MSRERGAGVLHYLVRRAENIGLKKRKRWEREGKERGKSRQLSPGMKMEFTADYKE